MRVGVPRVVVCAERVEVRYVGRFELLLCGWWCAVEMMIMMVMRVVGRCRDCARGGVVMHWESITRRHHVCKGIGGTGRVKGVIRI